MSGPLAKALLVALDEVKGTGKDPKPSYTPQPKGTYEVQFNPTSLKITRQNNQDQGASTTKSVRRQNPSTQSATLTFDLEFDTAEQADKNGVPVDVRTLTHIVRQFAEPSKAKATSPPPPVRFIWGTFIFQGLVTQLTEDLDYFAEDGRPLRAKVSVTITEKNPDWEARAVGAGARDQSNATPAGSGQGAGPGAPPAKNPDTSTRAQDGESLQQVLARMNADPAAWRAAMAGLDSPLGLAAGAQVQLAMGASAALGIGASAGFGLGVGASAAATLGAALGVTAGAGSRWGSERRGASPPVPPSERGSGSSAARSRPTCRPWLASPPAVASRWTPRLPRGSPSPRAVVSSRRTRSSPWPARTRRWRRPDSRSPSRRWRVPRAADASASIGSVAVGGLAAGATAALDPRTQGYGAGIPLRARAQATTVVSTGVGGSAVVTARANSDEVVLSTNAALPAWQALAASAPGRSAADAPATVS